MPIKDRKRRRLVRLGVIRLGYLKEGKRKNGTTYTYPAQADHFLLHDAPEIQEFYAAQGIEKVRELDVLLPFPDIDRNFDANYQVWAGGVLVCEGDGEYVSYATPFTTSISGDRTSVKNAPGDTHVSNGVAQVAFSWNGTQFEPGELVPCPGAAQDLYPHCAACKLSCLLKVMMADDNLFRMGYYQISTSSGRNHDTILGTLEALPADRVNGISFKLRMVEGSTSYKDKDGKRKKGTRWFLQLEPDPTITRKLYRRATERMLEAPALQIADRIDHGPEWSTEDAAPGYDGNGVLEYEADPPAPPPFAEPDAVDADFEEDGNGSAPELTEPHEWTLAESDQLCAWGREKTLTAVDLLAALSVKRLSEYPGDLDAAKAQVKAHIAKQADEVPA